MRGAVLVLLAWCAFALNPELDVSQYAHKSWTIRDGFLKGPVYAMTQSPDGYLLLGTEFGLLQFDGVQFTPWEPPSGQALASQFIRNLLIARDGTLWIGTMKELVSLKDGRLNRYPEFAGHISYNILEDRDGTIWAAGYDPAAAGPRLCAIQNGGVRCYGEHGEFGTGISALYEDRAGNLWVPTVRGVWRWKPGPPHFYPLPGQLNGVQGFAEDGGDRTLLMAADDGVHQLKDGKLQEYVLPGAPLHFRSRSMLRDRDGGLWIGTTTQGLFHVHNGKTDTFTPIDGLSGNAIFAIFQDREGSIWLATDKGLDRFREFSISTYSASQGFSGTFFLAGLAARDGSIWLTTTDGLKRLNRGIATIYRRHPEPAPPAQKGSARVILVSTLPEYATSLFEDHLGRIWVAHTAGLGRMENDRFIPAHGVPGGNIFSIVEDTGRNLWLLNQHRGLIRLSPAGEVNVTPWSSLRPGMSPISMAADPRGGLWIGNFPGGLIYRTDDGHVRTYSTADGLGKGIVKDLRFGRDGTLWASTEGGLSRMKDGHISTLTTRSGLPCDAVSWSIEDDHDSFWLYTACGLARIPVAEVQAWAASGKAVHPVLLDGLDGVKIVALAGILSPQISKAPDGRLWFAAAGDGISVIDPQRLSFNKRPAPVHIERIIADRKSYRVDQQVRLPALTRDLEIDYTALSLVAPEKNRFRYKLEGHERDWQDAGTRRQAFYNDLPPRKYRFRVIASNNSGVWNEAGDTLEFSIAPAYYQRTWFQALLVVAFFAVLWGLHRYRLHQIARVFNARLEARVAERTRVARELHDTLLQSFQGTLMKFSAISYLLPDKPEAKMALENCIEQARAAITEGRDAVQGLRASTVVANDLARAITTFWEGLAADQTGQNCPEFRLKVEGKSRDLPPLVRDEVYHIACESLRNALRHAQAKQIDVEIHYDPRQFRFRVVDNGKGIDQAVLDAGGRAGHHGLPGLHERAQIAGGKLSVWSKLDSGTEIELTIPASIAYTKSTAAGSLSSGTQSE